MGRVCELELSLRDATPRTWRRVRVPADLSLADLHRVIQVLMQWDDVHPHVFDVGGREYGPEPDEDEVSLHWAGDDRDITVAKAVNKERVFEYTYDFGSERRVMVTAIGETSGGRAHIECVDGGDAPFDRVDANARLADEFRGRGRVVAGASLTAEGQLVADLTLVLLYLTSFEGKGRRVANKTLRVETLDALGAQALIVTNIHRKGVELTPAGVARAEVLLQQVASLLRSA